MVGCQVRGWFVLLGQPGEGRLGREPRLLSIANFGCIALYQLGSISRGNYLIIAADIPPARAGYYALECGSLLLLNTS